MTKGLVVPADETLPAIPRQFNNLEDYQYAVGGQIEPIEIPGLGVVMYLNEEGRPRELPFNSRVTFLHWFHVLEARNRSMLVGDAVLVGPLGSDGDHVDLPDEVVYLFSSESRFIVEARQPQGEWIRQSSASSYFDAAVWAMLLSEKAPALIDVKVRSV